jgi:mRNA interferase RelE/StbE
MSFELRFKVEALREWRRLDAVVRDQFKKKLSERLEHPRVAASKLFGHPDRYKIKLRGAGYRLVYEVRDAEVVMMVVAIGKREHKAVYKKADQR